MKGMKGSWWMGRNGMKGEYVIVMGIIIRGSLWKGSIMGLGCTGSNRIKRYILESLGSLCSKGLDNWLNRVGLSM